MSPYLRDLAPPFTLGYDFVGRVEATGDEVGDLDVGDLVADVVRFGANSDLVVRPAAELTKIDPGADPLRAEIMAMTGVTALQMLTRYAGLVSGETVLVNGASGSVGLVAVAVARLLGAARVVGTASAAKFDLVAGQGGDPVDREARDVDARLRDAAPRGYDVIIDSVGGGEVSRLGRLLSPHGRLVTFGLAGFARGGALRSPALAARVGAAFESGLEAIARLNEGGGTRASDYDVSTSRTQRPEWYAADLAWLIERSRQNTLCPPFVAHSLDEAANVHAAIDAGFVLGRAVFDHREVALR